MFLKHIWLYTARRNFNFISELFQYCLLCCLSNVKENCGYTENRVVMISTLLSLAAPHIVIMTIFSAISDTKVVIMATLKFSVQSSHRGNMPTWLPWPCFHAPLHNFPHCRYRHASMNLAAATNAFSGNFAYNGHRNVMWYLGFQLQSIAWHDHIHHCSHRSNLN